MEQLRRCRLGRRARLVPLSGVARNRQWERQTGCRQDRGLEYRRQPPCQGACHGASSGNARRSQLVRRRAQTAPRAFPTIQHTPDGPTGRCFAAPRHAAAPRRRATPPPYRRSFLAQQRQRSTAGVGRRAEHAPARSAATASASAHASPSSPCAQSQPRRCVTRTVLRLSGCASRNCGAVGEAEKA